ncbi:carotenoid oxygenase family protein [Geodermatophilus ruber]|uniref:Dioxygenase n=1 Tax=Geodermatophilus ruber TaxID=504800 RepID=A0A1I4ISJ3_9ACTN|nr:carotenoid oxygenase family protein [Geodermatophilus ruber]SFL56973.1 carotenoid cleavage dioxygenase [Geodermatophilus ruber]
MAEDTQLQRSPFLEGPYAPVTEEITAFDLPVTGRLPAELTGRYLRNGPNPLGLDDPGQHWFLGPGMVHGVRLRDGRAEWYRNRWVRSRAVAEALGETWPGGPVHNDTDFAANTHVLAHAGRTLATVEAGSLPYELTPELETIGPCDFGGTLPGGYAAHTKLDRRTGDLHALAYFWGWDHVQHVVIGPDGRVRRTTDVPVADGPMMHDFALTERYVVLLDLPVTFSMDAATAGSRLPYTWNPAHPPRVGLLPREGAPGARWFEVDPCWVFHTLNAYDDGDRVVVDLCRYDGGYDLAAPAEQGPLTLDRWTVDPVRGTVAEQRLDDRAQEFPRVDDRVVSRPHRFGYSAALGDVGRDTVAPSGDFADGAFTNALLKHDLATGTVQAHPFGRDAAVGEAVFAPSAPRSGEDDGYVLAFVHDPDRGAADLVVLAAQDFAAGPVARVHLPVRVPLGFHGNWIADPG